MIFVVLFCIGIVITVGTRIAINILCSEKHGGDDICKKNKTIQIIMHALVIICIVLVGGIAVAALIAGSLYELPIWKIICLTIVLAVITYIAGYYILGLDNFYNISSHIAFIVVFIISIIAWTIPISHYYQNIETITETINEKDEEEKRQLIYFCEIPVQDVSGYVSGGLLSTNGNISTNDELPYWYFDENGSGEYDSVPAKRSHLIFINDNEEPYVIIVTHRQHKKDTTINHNTSENKTSISTYDEKVWKEYFFYLPESIQQFKIG